MNDSRCWSCGGKVVGFIINKISKIIYYCCIDHYMLWLRTFDGGPRGWSYGEWSRPTLIVTENLREIIWG